MNQVSSARGLSEREADALQEEHETQIGKFRDQLNGKNGLIQNLNAKVVDLKKQIRLLENQRSGSGINGLKSDVK